MTENLASLVDHYEAMLKREVILYETRRAQIAKVNAPARLLEFDAQFRERFGETKKQLMGEFGRELSKLAAKRERQIVHDAVHEAIEKGLIKLPDDEVSGAPPLDAMNEQVQMYMHRHSETIDKLMPLTPSKRCERLTAEAKRFDKLKTWRARDPELSAIWAAYYRHLAATEKPCKRGRKQNETALSLERAFVNFYLPTLRRPLSDFSVVLKCREELSCFTRSRLPYSDSMSARMDSTKRFATG